MSDIHSCSYYCDRPACIKAQRDELRDRFQVMQAALQRSGEPVVFTCHGNNAPAYGCNKPGDMSGTYYKAPQPVVDEDWLPTSANINALAAPVRRYIHDLITNADPSGMVAENTLLRDQTRQLDAMIGRLKAQPVVDEGYVLVSRAAVTEVLRISDRQHPAWEEVRTALLSAGKGGQ